MCLPMWGSTAPTTARLDRSFPDTLSCAVQVHPNLHSDQEGSGNLTVQSSLVADENAALSFEQSSTESSPTSTPLPLHAAAEQREILDTVTSTVALRPHKVVFNIIRNCLCYNFRPICQKVGLFSCGVMCFIKKVAWAMCSSLDG
jgi:hypothetical protein